MLTDELRKKMLEAPSKPVSMVLDTDTKNEIDDQFAVVYSLLSSKEINVEAFHAALFKNEMRGYPDPALGMEASYQEIVTLLDKMGVKERYPVFRGSKSPLKSPNEPVESEAANNLIHLAMQEREEPLYVATIGAVTNVISAILMEPEIMERIVVVWLGAHPTSWDWKLGLQIGSSNHLGPAREFNLSNDPLGAMALFDSGVPLVWVPCKNVAEHLRTGTAEMEHFVRGQGEIGEYLADIVKEYFERIEETFPGESLSKVLWDISTIAYIINPMWVSTKLAPAPKFAMNKLTNMETVNPFEEIGARRHSCRIAMEVRRDYIYADFFQKLEQFAKGEISLQ